MGDLVKQCVLSMTSGGLMELQGKREYNQLTQKILLTPAHHRTTTIHDYGELISALSTLLSYRTLPCALLYNISCLGCRLCWELCGDYIHLTKWREPEWLGPGMLFVYYQAVLNLLCKCRDIRSPALASHSCTAQSWSADVTLYYSPLWWKIQVCTVGAEFRGMCISHL